MKKALRRRAVRLSVLVVGLLAAAGGIAYATIPDGSGVFTACKLNATGTIRLIDPSLGSTSLLGHCTSLETQISWNRQGQPEPQGPAGVSGYEVETLDATNAAVNKASGDAMSTAVTCPSGKKILSAGETGDWGPFPAATPSADGTTWTVTGTVQADSSNGLGIWMICATV